MDIGQCVGSETFILKALRTPVPEHPSSHSPSLLVYFLLISCLILIFASFHNLLLCWELLLQTPPML